jgi:hypothetical protein
MFSSIHKLGLATAVPALAFGRENQLKRRLETGQK